MAKVKAVVMAHRDNYKNVLVYTEDGQYLTTRIKPVPPVGSTIYMKPPVLLAKPKMLAVAAAVLLILFTGLMPTFAPTPAAAAYINLAWQPEIGLWVDAAGKVTQTNIVGQPDNDFAITLKGQDLYTALDTLLQYSLEQAHLEKQTMVIGTLIKINEQNLPHITEQQLKDFLYGQLEKQGYQGSLVVTSQPQGMIRAAEKAGMPLGKYTVYEECKQQNQPVKLDLLKQQDVPTALSQAGIKAGDVFGHHYMEVKGHRQNQENHMEKGTMKPGASGQRQSHSPQGHMDSSTSGTSSHTEHAQDSHKGMNRHN